MGKKWQAATKSIESALPVIVVTAVVVGTFLAWLTHIVVCIKTSAWVFLIAGAVFFPVAVVHGVGIWFGAW